MKTSLAILITLICGSSFGQTAIISHKSHSGTAMDFAWADPGNYGNPPITIERLVRINDTVIAAETNGWGPTKLIINNRELQDSLRDSISVMRLRDYQLDALVGKDTASKIIELNYNETPQQRLQQMEESKPKQQSKQQPKKAEKAAEPQKRKSSLLYFGLILAGSLAFGMLRKKFSRV